MSCSNSKRRRRRTLLGLLIGTLLLALGGNSAFSVAASDPVGPVSWIPGDYGNGGRGTDLGAYSSPWNGPDRASDLIWCITAGAAVPTAVQGSRILEDEAGPYSKMGYILHRYHAETHGSTRQAIAYLAHLNFDTGYLYTSSAAARSQVEANTPEPIKERARALWAEAQSLGGQAVLRMEASPDADKTGATIEAEVLSASGSSIRDSETTVSVTLSEGATFADGSSTWTFAPQGEPSRARVRTPLVGSFRATASTTRTLPPTGFVELQQGASYQKTITNRPGRSAVGASVDWRTERSVPSVSTRTEQAEVEAGSQARDFVTVKGGTPRDRIVVRSRLYAHQEPLLAEPTEAVPLGAVVVGEVTGVLDLDDVGNGEMWSAPIVIGARAKGIHTWVTTLEGSPYTQGMRSRYGEPTETFTVNRVPGSVSVTTRASFQVAAPGMPIWDVLTVEKDDLVDARSIPVTSTLWGPFPELPQPRAEWPVDEGLVVGRVQTDVEGPGEVRTPSVTIPEDAASGFYVWTAQVDALENEYQGFTSLFGEKQETTVIPWEPKGVTQVSSREVKVGEQLCDSVELSGLPPGRELSLEMSLYGPLKEPPSRSPRVPEGTPLAHRETVRVVTDSSPNGAGQDAPGALPSSLQTEAGCFTVPEDGQGYYTYVERVLPDPDDAWLEWTGEFGQVQETSLATRDVGAGRLPETGTTVRPELLACAAAALVMLGAGFTRYRRRKIRAQNL